MKYKINYLGFLSLLALIAILGFTTGNTGLFGFFGFVYYIRYFWVIPDEFFRLNVQKSATFAFMSEMISLVPFMFVCFSKTISLQRQIFQVICTSPRPTRILSISASTTVSLSSMSILSQSFIYPLMVSMFRFPYISADI